MGTSTSRKNRKIINFKKIILRITVIKMGFRNHPPPPNLRQSPSYPAFISLIAEDMFEKFFGTMRNQDP